ncbi:hypothetical protein ACWDSL_06715 [Streptomyces sp. NPDC000941]
MTTPATTAAAAVHIRQPDVLRLATDLRSAEDDLQELRGKLRVAVDFVHDPAYDLDARQALASRMGIPEPSAAPPATRRRRDSEAEPNNETEPEAHSTATRLPLAL